jgi:heme-degrading monooxygenase HmoA
MFVTVNYISCKEEYKERFEILFATRAKAIDRMEGFHKMEVLKPTDESDNYLIISHWESEENFHKWKNSPEFMEGHKRGFEDVAKAKKEGRESPMTSQFKTYKVIAK